MGDGFKLPAIPEGFGRAAEKLADTIRHVVDVAVGPDRIRAKAQAHADSAVILAEGDAKVREIETRAVERLRKREARRQHNIESITLKAFEALPAPEQISSEHVSEDWTSRFFEECQDISDEQMQQIWAKIMAGEVTRPGSFAPRTLSIVRNVTKNDANLFAVLCEFVWYIPKVGFVPYILDSEMPAIEAKGIHFATLVHLTSIGLVEFAPTAGYGIKTPLKEFAPAYFGKIHHLNSDGGVERRFELGTTIFTSAGAELVRLSEAKGDDAYVRSILETWKQRGWKEEEITPSARDQGSGVRCQVSGPPSIPEY